MRLLNPKFFLCIIGFFFSESSHSKSQQQTIHKDSNDEGHDEESSDGLDQIGTGQSESKPSTSQFISNEDAFVEKIALLVTQKIEPRLTNSTWKNFNLTSPNTAVIKDSELEGPIHYNNIILKDQENDQYGILMIIQFFKHL